MELKRGSTGEERVKWEEGVAKSAFISETCQRKNERRKKAEIEERTDPGKRQTKRREATDS